MPGCTRHPERSSRSSGILARQRQRLRTALGGRFQALIFDQRERAGLLTVHDPERRIVGNSVIAVRREGELSYLATSGHQRAALQRLADHAISTMRAPSA